MATETLKVPVLSPLAAEAFDRYEHASEKQRTADATSRKQKAIKKGECEKIIAEMGDSLLAKLPDGRLIKREKKSQDRSAQKATTVEWWELGEVAA